MSLRARQRSGWSAAFVLIAVCSLVPVVWIVMLSLKTPATATDGSFIPHHWTLSNYKDIFKLSYFWAMRQPIEYAEFETGIAHRHVHWYKKFRQVCSQHFRTHPVQFGGPNFIVEADEHYM